MITPTALEPTAALLGSLAQTGGDSWNFFTIEVLIVAVVAAVLGVGIGWYLWGRSAD